jgi:tetratricopeptide (TPR) repeat protein
MHQSGRFREAEGLYRQVLSSAPDHPDALHFLGVLAGQFHRHDVAVELIRRALSFRPGDIDARFNLATNLIRLGRSDEAIAEFDRVLQKQPDDPDAHLLVADLLRQASRKDEAISHLKRTIALRENNPDAYNNLGNLLQERGDVDDAIRCFERSLVLRPGNSQTLNNLGNALRQKGQFEAAREALVRAAAAQPDSPQIHLNLGNVQFDLGEPERTVEEYQTALKFAPSYPEAWNHLGVAQRATGKVEEALAAHRRALSLRPDYAEARYAESWALLLLGRFEEGWRAYESRPRAAAGWNRFPNPWKGEALEGRRILLHAEQGFGDTLQFARFASAVKNLGGRVILECQRELVSLLGGLVDVEDVVARDDTLPRFDVHCPLMSVPFVMNLGVKDIPQTVPYVRTDRARVVRWANHLAQFGAGLHVGIAWTGRATHTDDRRRSMSLADFAPLAELKSITFHSLQVGAAGDEVRLAPGGLRVIDHREELKDFSETAGLLANLDLVITVDTAVAHLAGVTGKDTWTLLHFAPDWRWMLEREDSPWYPSMRLFRQRRRADWGEVIVRIATELRSRYADPRRASASNAPSS